MNNNYKNHNKKLQAYRLTPHHGDYPYGKGDSPAPIPNTPPDSVSSPPAESDMPDTINPEIANASLRFDKKNTYFDWLRDLLYEDEVRSLIDMYHVGTAKIWPGATVFWRVDEFNRIHSGKIKLFDPEIFDFDDEPNEHSKWVHEELSLKDFKRHHCFFGQHLLAEYPNKPVCITGSEREAIVGSAFIPGCVWLAAENENSLHESYIKPLSHRKIVSFWPDVNSFKSWAKIVDKLKKVYPNATLHLHDVIERFVPPEEKCWVRNVENYFRYLWSQ